ncbi:MAG: winged helix-turn-helix transcriptional regulator, partial [Candidatus Bathyarchaeota archaeon]
MSKKLLIELLRDSKQSDRKLAKKLGVSQPTITRTRGKLEREGFIRSYTIIPDWRKLGFELMAFTFVKMDPKVISDELTEKVREYAKKFPNAIFVSPGEGMGLTGIFIVLHKNYRNYAQQLADFRNDWGMYLEDIQSFITVTNRVIKELSF